MRRSAVILAGGSSSRFGKDKGVIELAGKPLIRLVVDAVRPVVDETIVVTSSRERASKYADVAGANVKFALDLCDSKGPLIGALTGFVMADGEYALLVPFDAPFVSGDVVSLFFDLCVGRSATIPRWPNGQIEPLQAVYRTKVALEAARSAVEAGRLDMRGMIERMRAVRFVSTLVVQELDPELKTFFNVNTLLDLKRAGGLVKRINGRGRLGTSARS